MEKRKFEFLGFVVILLLVGFLNYIRKITIGLKLSKTGKFLYLATMITFTVGIMFVLYFTNLNNILSFLIGLGVVTLSEQCARLFITVGNHFNTIVGKIFNKVFGIDITDELKEDDPSKKS